MEEKTTKLTEAEQTWFHKEYNRSKPNVSVEFRQSEWKKNQDFLQIVWQE